MNRDYWCRVDHLCTEGPQCIDRYLNWSLISVFTPSSHTFTDVIQSSRIFLHCLDQFVSGLARASNRCLWRNQSMINRLPCPTWVVDRDALCSFRAEDIFATKILKRYCRSLVSFLRNTSLTVPFWGRWGLPRVSKQVFLAALFVSQLVTYFGNW